MHDGWPGGKPGAQFNAGLSGDLANPRKIFFQVTEDEDSPPLISRKSHVRENIQSFFAVETEMLSNCAVSSMVSPPKYRSFTNSACRG